MNLINTLKKLDACPESIEWIEAQNTIDHQQLWDSCPEPDWLLWIVAKATKSEAFSEDRKPLVRCCLELVKQIPEENLAAFYTAVANYAVYYATYAVYRAIKAGVRKETCLKIIHKHFPNPPKIGE